MSHRFKIDHYDSLVFPVALYYWSVWRWKVVTLLDTPEKARELYQTVKDLPEYLP